MMSIEQRRAFVEAIESGHLEKVRALLSNGLRVSDLLESDISPLHLAARCGAVDVCKLLIENGADVEFMGNTELLSVEEVSFRSESAEEILDLLLPVAKPSDERCRRFTLLLCDAVRHGRIHCVERLLRAGASSHVPFKRFEGAYEGNCPLCQWAGQPPNPDSALDHVGIGRILLRPGEKAPGAGHRRLALSRALRADNAAAVELLLSGLELQRSRQLRPFDPDVLNAAVDTLGGTGARHRYLRLLMDSGYGVAPDQQPGWVQGNLGVLLGCPGVTCETARLLLSHVGALHPCRDALLTAAEDLELSDQDGPPPEVLLEGLLALIASQPPSLLFLARDAVRSALGTTTEGRVARLPLPPRLQDLVLLRVEFP